MDAPLIPATVSNLVPAWEHDDSSRVDARMAATVVEQVVQHAEQSRRLTLPSYEFRSDRAPLAPPVVPPHAPAAVAPLAYPAPPAPPPPAGPHAHVYATATTADASINVDVDVPLELARDDDFRALTAADLAREALRARIIAVAEQREHRSAYEIAFILLAAAVAVLLAAPPMVRVLLAMRGIEV